MLTPRSARPNPQTARVVTTRATAGPIFARVPAVRSPIPMRLEEGLEAAPCPEKKDKRSDADHCGVGIGMDKIAHERDNQLQECLTLSMDAEHRRKLARSDLQAGRHDEARDNRMAQEVRKEPQPEQTHGQQQQAGNQRKRDGRPEVLR